MISFSTGVFRQKMQPPTQTLDSYNNNDNNDDDGNSNLPFNFPEIPKHRSWPKIEQKEPTSDSVSEMLESLTAIREEIIRHYKVCL